MSTARSAPAPSPATAPAGGGAALRPPQLGTAQQPTARTPHSRVAQDVESLAEMVGVLRTPTGRDLSLHAEQIENVRDGLRTVVEPRLPAGAVYVALADDDAIDEVAWLVGVLSEWPLSRLTPLADDLDDHAQTIAEVASIEEANDKADAKFAATDEGREQCVALEVDGRRVLARSTVAAVPFRDGGV